MLGCAGLRDRRLDRCIHRGFVHLLRQEFADDGDLGAFLVGEFGAPGLLVNGQRFLAGLHHFGEDGQFVGAADDFARPAHFDLAILQRGHNQPQGADAQSYRPPSSRLSSVWPISRASLQALALWRPRDCRRSPVET